LLSLPVPHDEIPEDPVKTVVGSTFDQLILKNTNDVVLMFFSPWGEHSDWFQPIYEEFAAQMEPVTNLKFFKMDGTQNDWPRALFPCKGYPAIFFFKVCHVLCGMICVITFALTCFVLLRHSTPRPSRSSITAI
jgi:thiol-disulfide isomerase/thioredoxin